MEDEVKVLIACEESGIVRDAFISRGHDAWSCDLKPTRRPGPHYQCDVREVLYQDWDMLIAHPVCRYLTNSGVRWLHERPERWKLMVEATTFFLLFEKARHIPRRAIENPIMHKYAIDLIGRKPDQYVHPWWFGDPYSKATGLWLHGLPKLKQKYRKSDYAEIRQDVWKMAPGPDRERKRSETYPGIADAMAELWGNHSQRIIA